MIEYIFAFIVAAVVTYLVTPLVRYLAFRWGAITPVRARDVHSVPIPRLGGVAMLIGFLAAVMVGGILPRLHCVIHPGNGDICGGAASNQEIRGVAIGAILMCLIGALDDIRELDWITKLAGQVVAAGAMALSGVQLLSLPLLGVVVLPSEVLVVITIVIVLISINAVNFIDGLDGLAAGIVAIAAGAFFLYAYMLQHEYEPANVFSTAAFISAATVGCCVGFLPHNLHPARLFMGDAGALLLGLLLASAAIAMAGNIDPIVEISRTERSINIGIMLPILVPIAVLALPLLDIVLAVFRRLRAGQKPWQADAYHMQHRMLRIGHTHRQAVMILHMWAAIFAFGAVSLGYLDPSFEMGLVLLSAMVAALVLTLKLPKWIGNKRL